jgi:hypothetical protein
LKEGDIGAGMLLEDRGCSLVGDFLVEKVCPATKEEELLKEMWNVGTPDERKVLTGSDPASFMKFQEIYPKRGHFHALNPHFQV